MLQGKQGFENVANEQTFETVANRARKKLEFQLALRASKSQNLLARANFSLAVFKKISHAH